MKNICTDNWKWEKLANVIKEAQPGFACGERDPNGIVQLRMNNVDTKGNLIWTDYLRVPKDYTNFEKYLLKPGDVVFNNTNSTELVGKSAYFPGYEEPVVFSNHFTRLRTREDKLDPHFLASWLQFQWGLGIFGKLCNRWIGQSAVKSDKLLSLSFPLPPLPEQKRIAAELTEQMEEVERMRKSTERQLEASKMLQGAYLQEVFESDVFKKVPTIRLGDLCVGGKGQYGTSKGVSDSGNGLPAIGMQHIQNGEIIFENMKLINLPVSEVEKYLLKDGDIIFNRTNSYELVGKSAVFRGIAKILFVSYLVRYEVKKEKAIPEYLVAYFCSENGQAYLEQLKTRAIGQCNINPTKLLEMSIPLPNFEKQKNIVSLFEEQKAQIKIIQKSIQRQIDKIKILPSSILNQVFGQFTLDNLEEANL